MSTDDQAQPEARPAEAEAKEVSLLDQAIKATKATEESRAQELLRELDADRFLVLEGYHGSRSSERRARSHTRARR